MASKPEIILLGTYHMAMNPESVNQHQGEISEIIHELKEFNPTKIAVEKSFLLSKEVNRRLQEYIAGTFRLGYDEVDQFGYRLAKELDHKELYTIDEEVNMTSPALNQVFEWAENYQPDLLTQIIEIQQQLAKMEPEDSSPLHRLKAINNADYSSTLEKLYLKLTLIGNHQHQVGAAWLKQWHQRDLSIFANVSRLAVNGDRILLLIGKDHLPLLNHFFEASGSFEMVPAYEYLPK